VALAEDQWIEWTAHNLAAGVPEGKLTDELVRNGFDAAEAKAIIDEIAASPIHAAARRLGADVRKWASLSDALLSLEAQASDFSRIPRVSNLSSEAFLKDYYAANRPVIIEDVASTWPAVAKWDLRFLRDRFGAEEVTYQWGRSADDHRDSFVDHSLSGPLAEFIDLIESEAPTNQYYLIAHDRLLDRPAFRPLLEDIVFDPRYFAPVDKPGQVFFWLGPQGTTTPLHRDLGNVYFAQIRGRKAVKMVPSKQMHKVYNETGYHSEVDFEDYSLDDYPLLRDVHVMEEVISPGELLFIPLGWWHHVKALDASVTITGNNFRFPNAFAAIF
jgi:cupin-like protein